ncbi:MAG: preprotein translocase subunit SecG [Candidatus Hydrogenedentota bacterium]
MWEYLFRWETLWWTLIALYIPTCLGLIAIVLLQKGKGVGFAGAFGVGGGSEAVFGPRGSVNFPVRVTYVLATLFMVLSLSMSLVAGRLGMGIAPEELDPSAQAQAEEEQLEGEGFGGFDVEDMDSEDMDSEDVDPEDVDSEAPGPMPDAEDLEFTDPEAGPDADTEADPEMEPEIELTPAPEGEADNGEAEEDAGEGDDDPGEGEDDPGEGEEDAGEGSDDAGEGEEDAGEGEEDAGEGGDDAGEGEDDAGEDSEAEEQ